jgi:hypothetical protein
MTDMTMKTIRYVRAWRWALDNLCFPFGMFFLPRFLIYTVRPEGLYCRLF